MYIQNDPNLDKINSTINIYVHKVISSGVFEIFLGGFEHILLKSNKVHKLFI